MMNRITLRWEWCEECRFPPDLMHAPNCSHHVSGLLLGTNSPGLLAFRITSSEESLLDALTDTCKQAYYEALDANKNPRQLTQEEYANIARSFIMMYAIHGDPSAFHRPDFVVAWMNAADTFARVAKEAFNERYNVVE